MNLKTCGKIRLRNPRINDFVTWKRSGRARGHTGFPMLRVSELQVGKRWQAKYEKCTFPVRGASRDWRKKNESKRHDATWESQIEQGACSKPNAALSSSFPSSSPTCPSLPPASPRPATRRIGDRAFAHTRYATDTSSLQLWSRRQVILNATSTGHARSVMNFPMFHAFIAYESSSRRVPFAVKRIAFNNKRETGLSCNICDSLAKTAAFLVPRRS